MRFQPDSRCIRKPHSLYKGHQTSQVHGRVSSAVHVMQVSAAVLCRGEASTQSTSSNSGEAQEASSAVSGPDMPLYNTAALRLWLLRCCQNSRGGGLRDKPGTAVDYYHTCYCLSGLAACQAYSGRHHKDAFPPVDPSINVLESKLKAAVAYYGSSTMSEVESDLDKE